MKEDLDGVTLTFAYGRNPKTQDDAKWLFDRGKDMVINHPNHRWNGSYCSICDTKPGDKITLRYNSNRDSCILIMPE